MDVSDLKHADIHQRLRLLMERGPHALGHTGLIVLVGGRLLRLCGVLLLFLLLLLGHRKDEVHDDADNG